jgi:hypothetical protein
MTGQLPPLPVAPAQESSATPAPRDLGVERLPLPAAALAAEPLRLPLPELGNQARISREIPQSPQPSPMPAPAADFTDEDLREALVPLVAGAMAGETFRDDASLEAMLRSTFRRALAEHQGGPFQAPGWSHRTLWHLQALFTSRSYDEVLSEKIRRFHVEEVHLLDRDMLSLVSYASSDPVRHAQPRRVGSFARQLALRVRDETGAIQLGFGLDEGRRTVIRCGRHCLLVAIIRGEANDLVKADLDYALKRIESRYGSAFVRGQPLLDELQPLLEECLLIQSPAGPAVA